MYGIHTVYTTLYSVHTYSTLLCTTCTVYIQCTLLRTVYIIQYTIMYNMYGIHTVYTTLYSVYTYSTLLCTTCMVYIQCTLLCTAYIHTVDYYVRYTYSVHYLVQCTAKPYSLNKFYCTKCSKRKLYTTYFMYSLVNNWNVQLSKIIIGRLKLNWRNNCQIKKLSFP